MAKVEIKRLKQGPTKWQGSPADTNFLMTLLESALDRRQRLLEGGINENL